MDSASQSQNMPQPASQAPVAATSDIPGGIPAPAAVGPEARQALLERISSIRQTLNNTKATGVAANGQNDAVRQTMLRQVFQKLQLAGVNLNDKASVAAFIEKLRVQNPVMAQNFERSMEYLLGENPQDASQSVQSPSSDAPIV